jgi:hypothetical protein
MTDIAERLRTWCHHPRAASAQDLMDEAADEIERLREAIRRLAEQDATLAWISVKERLPPPDVRVLILLCNNMVDIAALNWKYGWMYDDYGSPEPTYWMPFPPPPDATLSVQGGNVTVTMDATLTDEERNALEFAVETGRVATHDAATLRGLLERTQ